MKVRAYRNQQRQCTGGTKEKQMTARQTDFHAASRTGKQNLHHDLKERVFRPRRHSQSLAGEPVSIDLSHHMFFESKINELHVNSFVGDHDLGPRRPVPDSGQTPTYLDSILRPHLFKVYFSFPLRQLITACQSQLSYTDNATRYLFSRGQERRSTAEISRAPPAPSLNGPGRRHGGQA